MESPIAVVLLVNVIEIRARTCPRGVALAGLARATSHRFQQHVHT